MMNGWLVVAFLVGLAVLLVANALVVRPGRPETWPECRPVDDDGHVDTVA